MDEEWTTQAGVYGDNWSGFVSFGREGEMQYQLLATSAREFGAALIPAADAAERDEDFCKFLVSELGASDDTVRALLGRMRIISEARKASGGEA